MGHESLDQEWSSRGLLRVIKSSLDPIIVSDAEGVIQLLSDSVADVFGWEPKDLVGQNVRVLVPDSNGSQHDSFIARYHQTRIPHVIGRPRDVEAQRRDGERFLCELCISRVDVPEDPRLYFMGIVRDITLRQKTEDRWRALIQATPAEILMVDRDLRIQFNNRMESSIGRMGSPEEYIAEGDRDRFRSWMRNAFETGERASIECAAESSLQGRRLSCQIQPLPHRGESQEAVLLLSDVTELHRARRSLETTRGVAAVGQLAARIGHQINNPLASIKNATLLLGRAIPESHPDARFLGMISSETDQIAKIVRQLLDVHSPERASTELLPLRDSLVEIVTLLNASAGALGVEIIYEKIDPVIHIAVPHGLLREIVFQLLKNAIDAAPSGTAVEVEARVDGSQLRVSVRDAGEGFAHGIAEFAFEPYFTTRGSDRFGLGLSICQHLAEAMGGTVSHHAASPVGTVAELIISIA